MVATPLARILDEVALLRRQCKAMPAIQDKFRAQGNWQLQRLSSRPVVSHGASSMRRDTAFDLGREIYLAPGHRSI